MKIWEIRNPIQMQGEKRRAELTVSMLQPHRTDIILDVGCGDAYQLSYVMKHKPYTVGIDVSRESLKEGKRRVEEINLILASSERLPFRPRIFSKILCLELLEHLEHPLKTINEIGTVLKENGAFVVSVPYQERIVMTECIHCGKLTPLYGHRQSFDEQKLLSLLSRNYLLLRQEIIGTVVSAYPLFKSAPLRLWRFIDHVSGLLPGIRPCWLVSKFQKV